MKESAEFYGNKVIKEFKDKYVLQSHHRVHSIQQGFREPKHVEWVRAWISLLEEQRKYVMEFHTTGLVWNPKVSTTRGSLLRGSFYLRACH